jgi:hypothetical protein
MSTTASKMQSTMSKFFEEFLESQDTKTTKAKIVAAWNSEETQDAFKALIKKSEPKTVRSKKPKDAPKNAKSAYMFFCADERVRIKDSGEEVPPKEVMALLAARWAEFKKAVDLKKKVAVKEMVRLTELATDDKARYESEKESYVPSDTSDSDGKKSRSKKDPNAPKGALSAYMFFCKDKRAELKDEQPDLAPKDVMAALGVAWAELKNDDEEEVARFQELAEADKERYQTEKDAYNSEGESDEEKPKKKKAPTAKKPAAKKAPSSDEEGESDEEKPKKKKPAAKKPAAKKAKKAPTPPSSDDEEELEEDE